MWFWYCDLRTAAVSVYSGFGYILLWFWSQVACLLTIDILFPSEMGYSHTFVFCQLDWFGHDQLENQLFSWSKTCPKHPISTNVGSSGKAFSTALPKKKSKRSEGVTRTLQISAGKWLYVIYDVYQQRWPFRFPLHLTTVSCVDQMGSWLKKQYILHLRV